MKEREISLFVPDKEGEKSYESWGEVLEEASWVVVVGVPGAGKTKAMAEMKTWCESRQIGVEEVTFDTIFQLIKAMQDTAVASDVARETLEQMGIPIGVVFDIAQEMARPDMWPDRVWQEVEVWLMQEYQTRAGGEGKKVLVELPGVGKGEQQRGWELVMHAFGPDAPDAGENKSLVVVVSHALIPWAARQYRPVDENNQEAPQPAGPEAISRLMQEVLEQAAGLDRVALEDALEQYHEGNFSSEMERQFLRIAQLELRYWVHKLGTLNEQAKVTLFFNSPSRGLLEQMSMLDEKDLVVGLQKLYPGYF